jgi:hypothetical protein
VHTWEAKDERKTPQSRRLRETRRDSVRFAVPEKRFRLSLIFAFFDRCRNCGFAFSATGSAKPQFPLGRGAKDERKTPQSFALRETANDNSPWAGEPKMKGD